MSPVTLKLKDRQEDAKANVIEFLENAKKLGLLDCVIIGSLPGHKFQCAVSDTMNRAELIGNIEIAKLELFTGMKGDDNAG